MRVGYLKFAGADLFDRSVASYYVAENSCRSQQHPHHRQLVWMIGFVYMLGRASRIASVSHLIHTRRWWGPHVTSPASGVPRCSKPC